MSDSELFKSLQIVINIVYLLLKTLLMPNQMTSLKKCPDLNDRYVKTCSINLNIDVNRKDRLFTYPNWPFNILCLKLYATNDSNHDDTHVFSYV